MSSRQEESANYRSSYEADERASDAQNVNYKREKPEHRAENRLEKFQEALDHTAAGDGEKADFNRKVAEDFRNETNILQYPPEERLKYMETYVEGFNEMDHPSFKERANAAKDIAQSTFKPVYNEFEAVEANNAEKIPDDLRKIFDKEKITEFKYNDETGNIEFDFKDMKQLERIAKKANRQVHVVRMDSSGGDERGAGSDEKNSSGSGPSPDAVRARERATERERDEETEHRTAWMTTQEDQSVSDAKRRKEIERAMNDFQQALLWSHKYTEEKTGKMAEALERGAKYVDMPEREIDQQNNFKNMETLDTEELEHRVDGMVQQNWDGVYEAIDKVAAEHPEEAQSLRYAADAMKAAYAESIIEDFKNDQKAGDRLHRQVRRQRGPDGALSQVAGRGHRRRKSHPRLLKVQRGPRNRIHRRSRQQHGEPPGHPRPGQPVHRQQLRRTPHESRRNGAAQHRREGRGKADRGPRQRHRVHQPERARHHERRTVRRRLAERHVRVRIQQGPGPPAHDGHPEYRRKGRGREPAAGGRLAGKRPGNGKPAVSPAPPTSGKQHRTRTPPTRTRHARTPQARPPPPPENSSMTQQAPPHAGHYRCIVIDPPWDQGKTGTRAVRPKQGRDLEYATMTLAEIEEIKVPDWASKNAFMWLWATNGRSRSSGQPILQQAFNLMSKWGFRYYTILTWDKGNGVCPFGPYQITTEHCLFGYRGKFDTPRESMGRSKTLFSEPSKRHSQKPSVLYERIREHFPSPRLDVFARRPHPGVKGGDIMDHQEMAETQKAISQRIDREAYKRALSAKPEITGQTEEEEIQEREREWEWDSWDKKENPHLSHALSTEFATGMTDIAAKAGGIWSDPLAVKRMAGGPHGHWDGKMKKASPMAGRMLSGEKVYLMHYFFAGTTAPQPGYARLIWDDRQADQLTGISFNKRDSERFESPLDSSTATISCPWCSCTDPADNPRS